MHIHTNKGKTDKQTTNEGCRDEHTQATDKQRTALAIHIQTNKGCRDKETDKQKTALMSWPSGWPDRIL